MIYIASSLTKSTLYQKLLQSMAYNSKNYPYNMKFLMYCICFFSNKNNTPSKTSAVYGI